MLGSSGCGFGMLSVMGNLAASPVKRSSFAKTCGKPGSQSGSIRNKEVAAFNKQRIRRRVCEELFA